MVLSCIPGLDLPHMMATNVRTVVSTAWGLHDPWMRLGSRKDLTKASSDLCEALQLGMRTPLWTLCAIIALLVLSSYLVL